MWCPRNFRVLQFLEFRVQDRSRECSRCVESGPGAGTSGLFRTLQGLFRDSSGTLQGLLIPRSAKSATSGSLTKCYRKFHENSDRGDRGNPVTCELKNLEEFRRVHHSPRPWRLGALAPWKTARCTLMASHSRVSGEEELADPTAVARRSRRSWKFLHM